jgi:2-methylcitrate dehydratase PrpD
MNRTRDITDWGMKFDFEQVPASTLTLVKALYLKTVTGMLHGAREPIAKIVTARYLPEGGGTPEAGVVAGGMRTSLERAAFANGTFAHASELEDNELPSITSAFWLLPALLSVGERYVSSGREMVEAAVVAWEIASRFNRAGPGASLMRYGIMPPSVFCTLGVALGTSRLAGLTADQAEHAVNISGSYAFGLGESGSDAHFLSTGHTCMMGINSALLARAGATGRRGALEERGGLYAALLQDGKLDLDTINRDLGATPYLIESACIKKYSACTYSHTSIDALALMMKEHQLTNDMVERVETQVSAIGKLAVGNIAAPRDLLEARFSLEYLLGEVLVRGAVDIHSFTGIEKLEDPVHKAARHKIGVKVLDGVPEASQVGQVTVFLKDGRSFTKRLEEWIGSPSSRLTLDEVRDLCRPYLETMLSGRDCDRVEDIVLNLEHQHDVLELMDILTFARVGRRG